MRYSDDELLDLIELVEEQGGAHAPEAHIPRMVMMTVKTNKGERRENVKLCGCGFETIFVVPYAPGEPVEIPIGHPTGKAAEQRRKQIPKLETGTMRVKQEESARFLENGAGLLRVCAVDDHMGDWPRFSE